MVAFLKKLAGSFSSLNPSRLVEKIVSIWDRGEKIWSRREKNKIDHDHTRRDNEIEDNHKEKMYHLQEKEEEEKFYQESIIGRAKTVGEVLSLLDLMPDELKADFIKNLSDFLNVSDGDKTGLLPPHSQTRVTEIEEGK